MTAFASLIPDALGFFDRLAANNNRDWFAAQKSTYDAQVKRPAEALLDEMSLWFGRTAGVTVKPKLYRIHRDVRFSKDKTPYNTHLHLQWSDTAAPIAYLFGASRGYVCAGVGAMGFDKNALTRWRDHVASDAGAATADRIAALRQSGHRIDPPALKRVPAPYPADHPRGDLLKHKGIVVWRDLDAAAQTDPLEALQTAFAGLGGFAKALSGALSP